MADTTDCESGEGCSTLDGSDPFVFGRFASLSTVACHHVKIDKPERDNTDIVDGTYEGAIVTNSHNNMYSMHGNI